MLSDKKTHIRIFIYLIIYKLLLDYVYKYCVTSLWAYQGFADDFNFKKYILAWLVYVCFIPSTIHFFKVFNLSSIMMICFNLIFFMPFLSVYSISNFSSLFFLYTIVSWFLMTLFLYKSKPIILKKYSSFFVFFSILIVSVLINTFLTIHYYGFHLKFDLKDVYDIRLAVRDMNLPGFYGYLKPVAKIFTLIGIVLSIVHKRWSLLIVFTICQLMNFAFGAQKSDFFFIFIAYGIGFLWSDKLKYWFIYGLVLLMCICVIEYQLYERSIISDLIVRRMFFMPSEISFNYFNFFTTHDLALLRNSVIGRLGVSSPYHQDIARVIGWEVYGSNVMNANTGICGDDFAQLGWWGLLFYPAFHVFLMRLLESCAEGIDPKIVVFISISFALNFISGSLFSVLLTGAFLITCFALFFYPKGQSSLN